MENNFLRGFVQNGSGNLNKRREHLIRFICSEQQASEWLVEQQGRLITELDCDRLGLFSIYIPKTCNRLEIQDAREIVIDGKGMFDEFVFGELVDDGVRKCVLIIDITRGNVITTDDLTIGQLSEQERGELESFVQGNFETIKVHSNLVKLDECETFKVQILRTW